MKDEPQDVHPEGHITVITTQVYLDVVDRDAVGELRQLKSSLFVHLEHAL